MARRSNSVISLLAVSLLILTASTVYAQRGRGIRSVDFRNHTYQFGNESIRLRNGKYESPENPSSSIMDGALAVVRYVDFDGDGQEEAAVDIGLGINGTMGSSEEYFVFAYRNGTPQQIFHESREKGTKMRVIGRSIIISTPFWRDSDAHCCPSAIATDTYSWRGSHFVRISHRLRPFPK